MKGNDWEDAFESWLKLPTTEDEFAILTDYTGTGQGPMATAFHAAWSNQSNVATLQVWFEDQWLIVGVFATKELAEMEASLRGYTKWSASEWGVKK